MISGIDTTAPVITVSSPTITTAASKAVSATDDDTGTTTWVYKQIPDATTCDSSALSSDTTAYTEGTDITLSSESDNGTKICFSSEDAFSRTTYAASAVIAGIDTTAPSITVSSPTTAIALSKGVSAVDDDTGTTTWVYKLIAAATTCDSSALSSDTTAYTEGENITLSSEGDNGQKICFRSRDTLNRDTFAASTVIAGIDTTAPVITVSSPTITTAASKTVSATDDDTGTTTWVYKQIAAATTCDNSALTSDTNTYTEGDAITLSSESDNGTKICFSATDGLNRTTYAASAVIAGIDTTAEHHRFFTDDSNRAQQRCERHRRRYRCHHVGLQTDQQRNHL